MSLYATESDPERYGERDELGADAQARQREKDHDPTTMEVVAELKRRELEREDQ